MTYAWQYIYTFFKHSIVNKYNLVSIIVIRYGYVMMRLYDFVSTITASVPASVDYYREISQLVN